MLYNSDKILNSKFGTSAISLFTGSSKFYYTQNEQLITQEQFAELSLKAYPSVKETENNPKTATRYDMDGIQLPLYHYDDKNIKPKHSCMPPPKKRAYKLNKSKVKRRLYSYFQLSDSQKRMSFVTITFPFETSDNQAYMLFNLWLTKLRSKGLLLSYLWVVERQKNGTVHFHMLTSNYVKIKEYNELMRESMMNLYAKDIHVFKGYKPDKYNGIDLAKNKKTGRVANFATAKSKKALSMYITKYITKNDTKFFRLTWHCSRNISVLFSYVNGSVSDNLLLSLMHEKDTFVKVFENLILYVPKIKVVTDDLKLMWEINDLLFNTFT